MGNLLLHVNSCNPEAGDTDHNVARTGVHPGFRGFHIMTLCKMRNFRTKIEWLHLIVRLCTRVAFQLNQVYETGAGPKLFELIRCDKVILFLFSKLLGLKVISLQWNLH